MVMLRTSRWPAIVISQEEVQDTRPSVLAKRWVSVNVFGKGERVVKACEVTSYPPPNDYFTKKPKLWKNAMALAAAAVTASEK